MLESRSFDGWRRLSRSVLEQASKDDPEALAQIVEHLAWVQSQLPDVVGLLRQPQYLDDGTEVPGYSWAQIGAALGVSRQTAQERFTRKGQHRG